MLYDILIRQKLFGNNLQEISTLIVTPINSIYKSFKQENLETYKGWWDSIRINKTTLIVKCPLGTHAEDTIYYSPNIEKLIFLGYCGSCKKSINCGDLFSPNSACSDQIYVEPTLIFSDFCNGKLHQVKCFHEQEKEGFTEKMQRMDISCIEMESAGLFDIAKKKTKLFGGLYVVTDNILNKKFYQITKEDEEKISSATITLRNIILDLVN